MPTSPATSGSVDDGGGGGSAHPVSGAHSRTAVPSASWTPPQRIVDILPERMLDTLTCCHAQHMCQGHGIYSSTFRPLQSTRPRSCFHMH